MAARRAARRLLLLGCAAGAAALQTGFPVVGGQPAACSEGTAAYYAVSPGPPGTCTLFCMPAGACEGMAQRGEMTSLHIAGKGTCSEAGFTAAAALSVKEQQESDVLLSMGWPCRGITMTKYVRPEAPAGDDGDEVAHPLPRAYLARPRRKPTAVTTEPPATPASSEAPSATPGPPLDPILTATPTQSPLQEPLMWMPAATPTQPPLQEPMAWMPAATPTQPPLQEPPVWMPAWLSPGASAEPATTQAEPATTQTDVCGRGSIGYEHRSDTRCTVFCLPKSCEDGLFHGKMKLVRITSLGTCRTPGFVPVQPSQHQRNQTDRLKTKYKDGPCKGMTMTYFAMRATISAP